MSSLARRSQQRRAERAPLTAHGSINLVPLIDILTSIVFFGLLTLTSGVMSQLTAYDLTLPPVVVTAETDIGDKKKEEILNLLVAVRIENGGIQVEHSEEGGFKQRINGLDDRALEQLQGVMTQIRTKYKQNEDVTVLPSDEIAYDDVIKVLERLRLANFRNISLGNRARGTTAAAAGTAAPTARPVARR